MIDDDMTGKQIKHYEIRESIGRGAMGEVYRAYDAALDREVAIKVLSPMAAPKASDVDRFYQEARAAANLSHPNVVVIHDVGEHDKVPYFVMELLAGQSLREAIETDGRMNWRKGLELVIQICRALGVAHLRGILHRDIKPDNVWLHTDGRVVVLDFGLAQFSAAQSLTHAGETMGTPEYMAPEQIMGEELDGRADLYALGILTYELLTGQPPFTGPNPVTVIYKQMEEAPTPLGQLAADVPMAVEKVVLKAMAKDPGLRYESVALFQEAVEGVLAGREESVEEPIDEDEESSEETTKDIRFHARLVGRDEEVKRLGLAIKGLESAKGETILVGGEAGVGKTRLVSEALALAQKKGALVLHGMCLASEGVDPYLPFIEALGQGLSSGDDAAREKALAFVQNEVPELKALTLPVMQALRADQEAGEENNIAASKERFFEAMTQALLFLSREKPVVLFLDDLHWADSGSLQLLHYLSRNARHHRLLILGTYRTEDLLPEADGSAHLLIDTMQKMSREGLFEKIVLAGLTVSDLSLMVRLIFKRTRFSDAFRVSLFEETGGNPFFAIEALKLLRDEGVIFERRGVWRASKEITGGDIPNRVYDVVVRRINRLTEDQRELLQVAAVAGEWFDSEALAAVVEQKRLQVLQSLNRLSRVHQLIEPREAGYVFTHAKIQEVLYGEITPELRQVYHLGYGGYLETQTNKLNKGFAVDLARHFYRGKDFAKALPFLIQAGERAGQRFAYREAREFYMWALEAVKVVSLPESELRICHKLGRTCRRLGDVTEAKNYFVQTEVLAEQTGALDFLADVQEDIGSMHFRAGHYDEASKYYLRSVALYQKIDKPSELVKMLIQVANIPFEKGDWKLVQTYYRKALRIAREIGDQSQIATIYMNSGIMATIRGEPDRALALYERGRVIFEDLKDLQYLAKLYLNQGWTLAGQKRWEDAREAYRKALPITQKSRHLNEEAMCHLNLSEVLLETGDLKDCKRSCLRALEIFEKVNNQVKLAEVFKTLGQVTTRERKWQDARSYFEKSIEIFEGRKHALFAGKALLEFAYMLKESSALDEAEKTVNRGMEWLEKADSKNDLEEAEALKKEIDGLKYLAASSL